MNWRNLSLYTFSAPFKSPVKTVKTFMDHRTVLVMSVMIDEKEYYAECNAFETDWYHFETIRSVMHDVMEIWKHMKHVQYSSYEELIERLNQFHQSPNATAMFDCILWQYFSDTRDVTVLIGKTLSQGEVYHPHIEDYAARIKLKWHDEILQSVKKIRAVSPKIKIVIDANGTLTEQDFYSIHTLNEYGIDYFEQPFNDIKAFEKCVKTTPDIRLAIDESAMNIEAVDRFYSIGVTHAVLKYSRLGGLYNTMNVHQKLENMTFISGGMYEFQLSKYFTAMLAEQFETIPDVTPAGTYFDTDYSKFDEVINGQEMTITFPEIKNSLLTPLA